MKKCELCKANSNIYCESDQASLCWECDHRVHRDNFLVAKHTRILLCDVCQSQTPWTGSGQKLTPVVTCCFNCQRDRPPSRPKIEDDEEEIQVVPFYSSSSSSSTHGRSKIARHR